MPSARKWARSRSRFNDDLNTGAELHSQWMINTDTFSHTGAGGSSFTTRMANAGYQVRRALGRGREHRLGQSARRPGYQDEVLLLHTGLMNSSGHRANILSPTYREVGLGFEVGQYGTWQAAFITEDFVKSGTSLFLTGVAFDDLGR